MTRERYLLLALAVAFVAVWFLPKREARTFPPPPVPEDVAGPPPIALRTSSGLAYRILQDGNGPRPAKRSDRVRVHYSGWTSDGKLFDTSVVRGEPATFALTDVIEGWAEGVMLMRVGEKARFWIPSALAYGDAPKRPGLPAGKLVFEIELLRIE